MRILQVLVSSAARTGGTASFVGDSATQLTKLGAEVRTLSTDIALAPWAVFQRQRRASRDEIYPAFKHSDLRMFPARFPRRMAFSPALYRELRRTAQDFDVVHIHNLWQFPQYAAARAADQHDVPYVVSTHGAFDPYLRERGRARKKLTMWAWQGRMLRGADTIHVTTSAERDLIGDIAASTPRAIVPCGVHVGHFSSLPSGRTFRERRLDGYDGPVILFLGRITDKKGVDVLIRAFVRVRREIDCHLVIAGPDDSGLQPKLENLARSLRLDRDVTFAGAVFDEERLAALAAADVWALSSHAENFGIAVVEAAAAGCPVVITPMVNLAADLEQADAGLVADDSPDPFAEALLKLLDDEELRRRLAVAAPEWAARYDWKVVAPQLLEMYRAAADASADTSELARLGQG